VAKRARDTIHAARLWQQTHPWPADTAEFERDTLPGLVAVPAWAIAEAMDLSGRGDAAASSSGVRQAGREP